MISKQEKIARLRLSRTQKIGTTAFWDLIHVYGSAIKALEAIPSMMKRNGQLSYSICSEETILQEIENVKNINGRFAFFEDALYPPLLKTIPDPPPVLTFLGNKEKVLSFYSKYILSIVGARNSSINANKFCISIAKELGMNNMIISFGLAKGIDTSAHYGSLESGTLAILPGGINNIYPTENKKLYNDIIENGGGILAEMPYGTQPQPQLFSRRNRIIAGIANATLVIEAAIQSGSLITANMALEYNRDVFSVPGSPMDTRCSGTNMLIKNGAILIENSSDILAYSKSNNMNLNLFKENFDERDINKKLYETKNYNLDEIKKRILESLNHTPITLDELIFSLQLPPKEILIAILELELTNKIARLNGQKICLSIKC